MSEQVGGAPAPRNPIARLIGVVSSPKETFEEIVRSPGWVAPILIYTALFGLAMGIWSMKADWITIMTDQFENNPFVRMIPEANRDEALNKTLEGFRTQSQAQIAAEAVVRAVGFVLPFCHGLALVYATLFVFMGSLKDLKLGAAWGNFLICLLMLVGYLVVYGIAGFAFREAPDSRILLAGTATVALLAAWIWMALRRTRQDVEWNRVISVCMYSLAVSLVWVIVFTAVTLGTASPIQVYLDKMVKSNLGAYVSTGVPALQALLNSLDIFTIAWFTVLTIGFRVVTKLSAGMTASIAFLPWAIVVLIKIAWAAVFG